jgi:hypothetical protein
MVMWISYRSSVNTSALSSGHDISLTGDVETIGKSLVLGLVVTANNGRDGLHLFRLEL